MLSLLLAFSHVLTVDGVTAREPAPLAQQATEAVIDLEYRLTLLEARVKRDEQIAVDTWSCYNRALLGAGADLMSTAAAIKFGRAAESNPLGFDVESRVALKLSQMAITGTTCYLASKGDNKTTRKLVSWTSFALQMAATVNNVIQASKGK